MGGSYQVTNTVTIPANAPPSCYLILNADDQNAIFEANETNNWRAFGVGQYRDADGDGIPGYFLNQGTGRLSAALGLACRRGRSGRPRRSQSGPAGWRRG